MIIILFCLGHDYNIIFINIINLNVQIPKRTLSAAADAALMDNNILCSAAVRGFSRRRLRK